MRLTPFGEAVRVLRLKYGISLKQMADAMEISSAYLSSLEFGDKRLLQKHINSATDFLKKYVTKEQLESVIEAGGRSKKTVDTSELAADDRGYVAAFARRLQEGGTPPPEVVRWVMDKS